LDELGAQPGQRGRGRVSRVADQGMHVAAPGQQVAGGGSALPAGRAQHEDGPVAGHELVSCPGVWSWLSSPRLSVASQCSIQRPSANRNMSIERHRTRRPVAATP
jgi:hypothetical protein